jgi:DNA-binding transcriptional LysR family regulator
MFRPVDWPMFGLKASMANLAPTSGAGQPLRESGELFPRWAARPRRRLTLGLTCSLHGGAARRLLVAFRAARPDVDLVIEDLDDRSVRGELDGRHIDAAIAADLTAKRNWRCTPLWRDRLVAVLPQSHPLAADKPVAAAELRGEIVLLAGDGSGDKSMQSAISDALGGPPASFMHYLVERDTLFDLVALGLGVTVCSGGTLGAFYPGVCIRMIDGPGAEIAYSLMWRADTRSDALSDLITLAETLAHEESHHGMG